RERTIGVMRGAGRAGRDGREDFLLAGAFDLEPRLPGGLVGPRQIDLRGTDRLGADAFRRLGRRGRRYRQIGPDQPEVAELAGDRPAGADRVEPDPPDVRARSKRYATVFAHLSPGGEIGVLRDSNRAADVFAIDLEMTRPARLSLVREAELDVVRAGEFDV